MLTDRAKALRPIIQALLDEGGIDAICEPIAKLESRISESESRITELEKRINKNSSNSSNPPSSDGLKRTKSLRAKNTGRKPGGQPGHPGQTLLQSEHPDITVAVPLDSCPECGGELASQAAGSVETRQVFDLPPIKMQVTGYQVPSKTCPHCGAIVKGQFPTDVSAPVQYGPGMLAVMNYLNIRQVIPCARTAEICQDISGHRPSADSVVQAIARCADLLAPGVAAIGEVLEKAPVLHSDETGVRCVGKTHWIHVASTASHSHFSHSSKRGVEGFAAEDIIPDYTGTLVHDFRAPYDTIPCKHSRFNAHLLRELQACAEDGHHWAESLTLLEIKKVADDARQNVESAIGEAERKRLRCLYGKRVSTGLAAHTEQPEPSGKRCRAKQSREHNLLRRLGDKQEEVLRFMNDLSVPFDNNQAGWDLRMIKVQQKEPGCFRSEQGARRFCTISSYLSTVRKHGMNAMDSLKAGRLHPRSCRLFLLNSYENLKFHK